MDNDLSNFAQGIPANAVNGGLAWYLQNDNSQHVIFIDEFGHVNELYRNPAPAAQWVQIDVTSLAGGTSPFLGSALTGYVQSDNSQHVNFIDDNGQVHELYLSPAPAAQWVDNNLTGFSGATPAALESPLVGYSQSDNSQHVNFIDDNGHVHELYRSPLPAAQWLDNNLTMLSGGTLAALESALVGYPQSDSSQHVNFIDGNGHVHELYRSPLPAAQWLDIDLTALDGGNPVGFVGVLDAYLQSDNSQHVNFISADEHVHELYSAPCGPWPVFHHDWRRTGLSRTDTNSSAGNQKWAFPTGFGNVGYSSPVIGADGAIYFGSNDGNLYAVNPNGKLKWKSPLAIASPGAPFPQCTPAIGANGTIYFASENNQFTVGNLYAVDPADGSVKWAFPIGGQPNASSPAIGANGAIYFGSGDSNLYALNPNGTLKWNFTTKRTVTSSPAVGADGTIYFGSNDSNLYALTDQGQNTVTLKWTFLTGNRVESSPAIGTDGTIYVGSDDGYLYAVNSDGTLKWKFFTISFHNVTSSPAIGADGTIYVGSVTDGAGLDEGAFYAVNPIDGTQKWVFGIGNDFESSPAIGADGTIYVGSDDGNLYALTDGGQNTVTVKWAFSTNGSVQSSSPAIGADGSIYFSSDDGNLYAVN